MLIFIDQLKTIRVMRASTDSSGKRKRERLGVISKGDFETPAELAAMITPEEQSQIVETIGLYKRAAQAERQAAVLNFPRNVREVVEYLQDGASESETHAVVFSMLEALRVIRKKTDPAQAD
jgi:hypothetical protein